EEQYEEVCRQIDTLTRHKQLSQTVSELTLRKMGIERETEQILKNTYELEQKDKEIAMHNEEHRYDMAITDSDLESLTEQRDKLKEELKGHTYTAPHDGYVTFVKDFSRSNYVESYENIVVVSDYDDLYIETSAVTTAKYQYGEYKSKWTYIDGKKVNIVEHPYTPAELSYAEGISKTPYQAFDPVGAKPKMGCNQMLFFMDGDSEEKLVVGNDSISRENGESFVYVKNAAGEPEKRAVELGATDGLYTEVISGVTEGEPVYYTNQYLPPSKYETFEAGLSEYAEQARSITATFAYPYSQIILAPAAGIYHAESIGTQVSEGAVLGSIISSQGLLEAEGARIELSKLDRNNRRGLNNYEAERVALVNAQKEVENVDAPDLSDGIDVEMGSNDDAIRSLRHIKTRLGIDMEILNQTEEARKKDYESDRKALLSRYQKLQKNASGDGLNVLAPAEGKVDYIFVKSGDEVYKGGFLMTLMQRGEDEGFTRLYIALPGGGSRNSANGMPVLGQNVTAKNEEKQWTGTCIGVNGRDKRFMLFTRDGKQCATYSAAFTRNNVENQFYVRLEGNMTADDLKGLEVNYPQKRFDNVIVLPANSVKEEYNMYSDTTKYYVWKMENNQVVKEYVNVYETEATPGVYYVLLGVNEKDTLLK
ncbi:MAG: efflux RND transporter periplasmic adaptor subunit, partial [Lachnospiraceae bacterium]|nr:efflux RND transporter periplasmic adaptor subunit [Lachnospiraceae bacterium]